jgi:hypothetical protein
MRDEGKRILAFLLISVVGVAACSPSASPPLSETMEESSPEPARSNDTADCDDLSPGIDNYSGRRRSPILRGGSGKVSAMANIFAAGRDAPPAPGGGGRGVLPPVSVLPSGSSRVVSFPRVAGRVNPIIMYPDWNGPDGDRIGPTDVGSFQGISGIFHRTNGMFLVGVFLTDAPPSSPAPPRLNFSALEIEEAGTVLVPGGEEFDRLVPEIGQTFLIGDGKGRVYVAPPEATRLFLGFADAFLYEGCPGWYGNNAGHLTVTVRVTEG